ncbi:LysR family transcriptional regulator [Fictibacillus barbaricus]|uniref:LysR family transcriptional regulator n=1 Tax=Fictibacillus barbaricus TaxID=182136 RepID=A0ABS2ZBI2_9BACL|nr:LysR family transcriptional regulator [Fictibacillus barbaricus]MBN3545542.1 LysR family transcriptional regulator [Fictibacillus barbaricus]GGB54229.1 LysR family transcriptional regulator [Fictibacillus barbaricus]
MSIGKYEIFHTVVELGSLTKASAALNISQSGVSHAISSLEKEMGFSLLSRNKTGIKLTVNGERMLLYIRDILYINEKMRQEAGEIKGLEIGIVRLGSFSSVSAVWLPGIAKKFMEQYPHITVEIMEGKQEELGQWITQGIVDFSFMLLPAAESFEVLHLKRELFFCVMAESHPLSEEDSIYIELLKDEKILLQNSTREIMYKLFKGKKLTPDVAFHLEDEQAIISMAKNGMGVAILPEIALHSIPKGVKILPLAVDEESVWIGIGSLTLKHLPPAAEKFIAVATLWLNDHYLKRLS